MTIRKFDMQGVVERGFCSGCGLCAGISGGFVSMHLNRSGFARPVPQEGWSFPPAAAQDLAAVCPGARLEHERPTAPVHALWGPLLSVWTGHATDPQVRHAGSSGGVISALACHLLDRGTVDAVVQVVAHPSEPLRNSTQISTTRADVLRSAGSRYAPASPLESLHEWLQPGRRLAFIGKPCDVAALRQYLRRYPDCRDSVPYMISFMCAGVPSQKATHDLVKRMGASAPDLVSFRYRGDGWPGRARAVQADGKSFELDYTQSWGDILGKQLQFRCKICPDGTGELADLVCADAWYGKDGYPDFQERDGRSLILARTARGSALLESALAQAAIAVEPLDVTEIKKMQPYQATRKQVVSARWAGVWLARRQAPAYRRLGLLRATLGFRPLDWARQFIGTFRRVANEEQ